MNANNENIQKEIVKIKMKYYKKLKIFRMKNLYQALNILKI